MLGLLCVVRGHSALYLSLPKGVLWEIISIGAAFGRKVQTSPGFA